MAKGKKSKENKKSGGGRKVARANQRIRAVKSKIKRWERYKEEGKKPSQKSKRRGWDTSGLKKHLVLLSKLV